MVHVGSETSISFAKIIMIQLSQVASIQMESPKNERRDWGIVSLWSSLIQGWHKPFQTFKSALGFQDVEDLLSIIKWGFLNMGVMWKVENGKLPGPERTSDPHHAFEEDAEESANVECGGASNQECP